MRMRKVPESYRKSADSWQMAFQNCTRLPFPSAWLMVGAFVFGVGLAIVYLFEDADIALIGHLGMKCALIAAIANAVIYYERCLDDVVDALPLLLDETADGAAESIQRWYHRIFWSRRGVLVGFALAVLVTAISLAQSGFVTWQGRVYGCAVGFLIGMLGGSMLWVMLAVAYSFWELGGKVKIRASIFETVTSPVRTTAELLFKVAFVASLVYVLGVWPLINCPGRLPACTLWVVGLFGAFVMLYFIIPQIGIHKALRRIKGRRLDALVTQIDRVFDRVTDDPTQENISQLRDLFDLQRQVNRKRVWSFGTSELLVLIGTIILPLLLFALRKLAAKSNS